MNFEKKMQTSKNLIMEHLDSQDLTLYLVFKYMKENGHPKVGQKLQEIGLSTGLDLTDVQCDTTLKDVIDANKNYRNRLDVLVYDYLKRAGYLEVAKELAKVTGLKEMDINR